MSSSVGIGIIGAGAIASTAHLPAYAKLAHEGLAHVVAIVDFDEGRAREVAERFSVPHAFTDYRDMLKLPSVDAVDVCTPNFLHKDPVIDSFRAGKHVICEKPIARNAVEGAEMLAASHAAGKKFQVALNLRFAAGPQAVRRFVDDGRLGEIYYARVHALRRRGIPGWGVFTQKDKQGGGPLIDVGVHIIDLTLWLLGHPRPVSVTGAAYTKFGTREGLVGLLGQWNPKTYTVEDFAVGLVRFENGATMTVESSFAANVERETHETTLLGTEGGVVLNPFDHSQTRFFREESGTLTDSTPVFGPSISTYEAELRAFVSAVRDDTPVPVPGEQALMVTRIIDAIYASADTGREIRLDES
ncbi:MAG: Gfo/Idh/MocA family protein [Capsulimonadaceae bacterium]